MLIFKVAKAKNKNLEKLLQPCCQETMSKNHLSY